LERGLSTNNLAANINARDMDPAEQDALRRAVAAMFELPKIKETQAAGPDQEQKSRRLMGDFLSYWLIVSIE